MARAGHPLPAVVVPGHNATFLNLPTACPWASAWAASTNLHEAENTRPLQWVYMSLPRCDERGTSP
jgi:hypothetical protein